MHKSLRFLPNLYCWIFISTNNFSFKNIILKKTKRLFLVFFLVTSSLNVLAQNSSLISACSDFVAGQNVTTWPHVLIATTVADSALSQGAQTFTMNVTDTANGASFRIAKTTANGNWFFGNPVALTLGSNSITVAGVGFDRAVKFQFSSGDVEFDALSLNGTSSACAVGASSWSTKTMGQPVGSCLWACNKTDKLILNLTPSTTYEYEMKAWYCGGGNSAWTGLSTFTTADDCPNVGNFTVTTPLTTRATFTWDDSNGPYSFMRIKARVDTNGSAWFNVGGTGVTYGTFTKNKNGLVPGETYRGQARTWCDPNGGAYKSPMWTSLVFWTQPTAIRVEGGTAINNLDVYPNPSRDIFNVRFNSDRKQDIEVRVVNLVGELIYIDNLESFKGEYLNSFNLSEYSKGIYLLELDTENGKVHKKMILQ